LSILIGYALVLVLCRIFESRLIFLPELSGSAWGRLETPRGLGAQDVWLTADDGTKLHAWVDSQ